MIHEESVLLLHSLQTTHSLILTRKIGKRDLRNIHTLFHLYNIQFLWICSHSLPMGKVIVWPTDLFTILSEKLEWNLSEISIFLFWNHVSNMLTCWGARFHPHRIVPAKISFSRTLLSNITIFLRWIHQMNGNVNTSYVNFLVLLY